MRRYVKCGILMGLSLALMGIAGCGRKESDNKKTEVTETSDTVEATSEQEKEVEMGNDMKLEGYNLVWEDEFDGEKLNEEDWNIELHEPGWVNNELQEYVASDENIYIKDGKLVIKPIMSSSNGTLSYTSGRVNTQGKHDFTYGVFEAKIKMPSGKGFLPAFWLMATDENIYGQWPRCGEIDITEVLGDKTRTSYSTIHYGNPHNECQGSYTLENGNFSQDFHTYAVMWEPGEIKWYVDGHLMHTANDWYSKTEGVGEITYPAPFDQPFYMILNLAVGGNWPGSPDLTTDFENADMQIDYVRVYQKDSYDENVEKPEAPEVVFREPDETGNYVTNADFSVQEDLGDDEAWKFLTANGGSGEAVIDNNIMTITSTAAGDVPYGVQLVHPDIPMIKTAKYKITFDAWADEARTMEVAVTAPDAGWIRYFPDTVTELTTDKQTYTFEFEVKDDNDANGRLEFNMGNTDSVATIYIQNVRLEMLNEASETDESGKPVLADGNYIYNSRFQEGEQHLGSWEITNNNNALIEVTPLSDGRRLHVASDGAKEDVTIAQTNLSLVSGTKYLLTFDAEVQDKADLNVMVGGNGQTFNLEKNGSYRYSFELKDSDANNIIFYLGDINNIYIDNIRVVEDVMIKNGSFNSEFTGYEVYVDSSAKATYVVDSLTEDNAADFTIENGGGEDWKIQLKQNNVELIQGHKYRLSVDAKSSIERSIRILMQGGEDKGWVLYSGENTVKLTNEFQTYTLEFEMLEPTDAEAFLSICMGNAEGELLNEKHRICIDNIYLEEIQ